MTDKHTPGPGRELAPGVIASAVDPGWGAIAQAKGLQHQCSQCGVWGTIVNACGCDPNNLPTQAARKS
jgi:hypothetical protein